MTTEVGPVFAPDHQGMMIDGRGVLARVSEAARAVRAAVATDDPERIGEVAREVADLMDPWALGELSRHLGELAERYYAGDATITDAFLQLYAIGAEHRKAAIDRPATHVTDKRTTWNGEVFRVVIVNDVIALPNERWSMPGFGPHISTEWLEHSGRLPGTKARRHILATLIVGALDEHTAAVKARRNHDNES